MKLPATGREGGLVAEMEADFAGQRAVLFELGEAVAGGLIHLIMAGPGEVRAGLGVAAIEPAAHRAEDELAAPVRVEGDLGGLDKIEEVGVPKLHLDDPPFADDRAFHRAAASRFGRRTRL